MDRVFFFSLLSSLSGDAAKGPTTQRQGRGNYGEVLSVCDVLTGQFDFLIRRKLTELSHYARGLASTNDNVCVKFSVCARQLSVSYWLAAAFHPNITHKSEIKFSFCVKQIFGKFTLRSKRCSFCAMMCFQVRYVFWLDCGFMKGKTLGITV